MRMRKGIKVLVGLCIWLFIFSQNSSAEEKKIVIADFEDLSNWQLPKPGEPDWANFALSAEQVYNGKYSGKFSWDRSDTKYADVSLYYKKRLPEKATEIGCWVKGSGPTGDLFVIYLVDNKGHEFQYSARIFWDGWKFIKWNIDEGMDPWLAATEIEWPLFFSRIRFGIGGEKGTIYLDDLTAIESKKEPIPETFYENRSVYPIVSNPPKGGLWFRIQEPYHLGYGNIEEDKKTLDAFKSNGLLDCPVVTSLVWVRPFSHPRIKGFWASTGGDYFGGNPEAPDSYFRKLCRLLEEREIYFQLLCDGNYWFDFVMDPKSDYNNYVKRLGKVVATEAPNHFVGFWFAEWEACTKTWNYDLSLSGRKKRANLTIKRIKAVLKAHDLDPKQAHLTSNVWLSPSGYGYEAGFYVSNQETLYERKNQELEISQRRGAARSFGEGQIWGTDMARWALDWITGEEPYVHPLQSNLGFPDTEAYKSLIRDYYSGSQYMGMDEWFLKEDGTLSFNGKIVKELFNYIKDHPRIGKDWTKTALVRGHLDNMFHYGPGQWKAWQYQPWHAAYIGDADRDWIHLNIFFPHLSHDENLSICNRYWTGTPYGPIDIIYDRVPDLEKALSNYEKVFFMGYQDITKQMYKSLANYVSGGGILFVEAPHLLNLKPSLQKELFGCKVEPSLHGVVGKISFSSPSIFEYPAGDSYPKNPGEAQGSEIYKLEIKGGEVIAKDTFDNPILVGKKYGQGYALLLANYLYNLKNYGSSTVYPTFNSFTYTLLDKIAGYPSLSLDISPKNDYLEFFARKDKGELQVFLMNHGKEKWEGEVLLNKRALGIGEKVEIGEATNSGYKNLDSEQFLNSKDTLKIKAPLEGNGEREAKFSLIKVVYQGEER